MHACMHACMLTRFHSRKTRQVGSPGSRRRGSVSSLFWSIMMLGLIFYIFGLALRNNKLHNTQTILFGQALSSGAIPVFLTAHTHTHWHTYANTVYIQGLDVMYDNLCIHSTYTYSLNQTIYNVHPCVSASACNAHVLTCTSHAAVHPHVCRCASQTHSASHPTVHASNLTLLHPPHLQFGVFLCFGRDVISPDHKGDSLSKHTTPNYNSNDNTHTTTTNHDTTTTTATTTTTTTTTNNDDHNNNHDDNDDNIKQC